MKNPKANTSQTVYKVVLCTSYYSLYRLTNGPRTFHSISSMSGLSLAYSVGEKTVPVYPTKIFGFPTWKDAVNFALGIASLPHVFIMRGIGENIKKISIISCDPFNDRNFWNQYKKKKKKEFTTHAPKNTIVMDSFTPDSYEKVERIK